MLNKSNQWIVLAVIAFATSALIGCNNGGGGSHSSVVDCRLPQNFNNATCLNARPGNLNPRLNGYLGARVLTLGSYARTLPRMGMVQLSTFNSAYMAGLCGSSSQNYRRGPTDTYLQNVAYVNPACLNLGAVIVTFKTWEQSSNVNLAGYGNDAVAYGMGWKLHFIPAGIQIPPNIDANALAALGPSSPQFNANVIGTPTGFQGQSEGLAFAGSENGNTMSISILGPQGPVGSGTMTATGY